MSFSTIQVDEQGESAQRVTITLNRPDKLNALSSTVLGELLTLFLELDARGSSAPRVVILTGAGGKAFAAGADVAEMSSMSSAEARDYSALGHRLTHTMESCRFPIIAVVRGFALGGGLELALGADFIVAADNAVFGMPETTLGLMPGFGGTLRLGQRIGMPRARQLVYQGRKLKAKEAQQLGLANEVVASDDLQQRVEAIAADIERNAPLAIASAKRVMTRASYSDGHTASELESQAFGALFDSEDTQRGMEAFVARRPHGRFEGR